jgi:hypothetical protein
VQGWVTGGSVLRAIARQLGAARAEAEAEPGQDEAAAHPPAPLAGYQVVELEVTAGSAADGARLDHIAWPQGSVPVSVLRSRRYRDASPGFTARPGDRISVLVPAAGATELAEPGPDGAEISPVAPFARTPAGPREVKAATPGLRQ